VKAATVYVFYDAEGAPLYVGVTTRGLDRFRHHRSKGPWFNDAASATFEHYDDPSGAYARERHLIHTLRPKHNIVGLESLLREPARVPATSLAGRLRRARQAASLTQEEVARAITVNVRTVTRWESGVAKPRPRALRRFAEVVGVEVAAIFPEPEPTGAAA
jgi:DNA-binding transcriptional regulator YiaG/predicted GIY-YIG superfamily endonuclease